MAARGQVDAASPGLERRRMGAEGIETGVLSLGSWHTWERMEHDAAVELAQYAIDRGVTLFDTGNYNSGMHNEGLDADIVLGRVLRETGLPRSSYQVALKLWLWNAREEALRTSFERDLDRVGIDRAEVLAFGHYAQNYPEDYGIVVEDAVVAAAELIAAGLADSWGACNWPVDIMRRADEFAVAEGLPRPQFAQLKYSLARRAIVEGHPYRRLFDDSEISLQASFMFEGGWLADKKSSRPEHENIGWAPGVTETHIVPGIQAHLPRIREVAADFGVSVAQFALAFCFTNPDTSNALLGATRLAQLAENIAAVEFARREGPAIRAAAEEFRIDFGVIDPRSDP